MKGQGHVGGTLTILVSVIDPERVDGFSSNLAQIMIIRHG